MEICQPIAPYQYTISWYRSLVADRLRPAAIKAGVILKPGQRFGFHNLRHSLSSLLITGQKSDVRTTQDILRHSSSATTIDLYTRSPMAQRIAAQESVLKAILKQPTRRTRIGRIRNASKVGKRKRQDFTSRFQSSPNRLKYFRRRSASFVLVFRVREASKSRRPASDMECESRQTWIT